MDSSRKHSNHDVQLIDSGVYFCMTPHREWFLLKWTLELRGVGELVSQNFGQFSTFHKLTEQHIFISFSQPIYKIINILFIYLT
jgi:hypothetical protein